MAGARSLLRKWAPVVFDLQCEFLFGVADAHDDVGCGRVAENIRERLLHDAICGVIDRRRKVVGNRVDVDVHGKPGTAYAVGERVQVVHALQRPQRCFVCSGTERLQRRSKLGESVC